MCEAHKCVQGSHVTSQVIQARQLSYWYFSLAYEEIMTYRGICPRIHVTQGSVLRHVKASYWPSDKMQTLGFTGLEIHPRQLTWHPSTTPQPSIRPLFHFLLLAEQSHGGLSITGEPFLVGDGLILCALILTAPLLVPFFNRTVLSEHGLLGYLLCHRASATGC